MKGITFNSASCKVVFSNHNASVISNSNITISLRISSRLSNASLLKSTNEMATKSRCEPWSNHLIALRKQDNVNIRQTRDAPSSLPKSTDMERHSIAYRSHARRVATTTSQITTSTSRPSPGGYSYSIRESTSTQVTTTSTVTITAHEDAQNVEQDSTSASPQALNPTQQAIFRLYGELQQRLLESQTIYEEHVAVLAMESARMLLEAASPTNAPR